MGSATINGPLLPTPPSALVVEHQPFGNWQQNRGKFHEKWCPNNDNNKGNTSATSRSDFTASMDFLAMMAGKKIGSEIKGILHPHNGLIHVAIYAKLSVIPPLTVLSFRTLDMDSSLVRIWH